MRIEAIFQNGTNRVDNVIPSLNSAQQDKPTGLILWTSADGDGQLWVILYEIVNDLQFIK